MPRTADGFLTSSLRAISAGRIWKSLFNRNHLTPAGKLPERSSTIFFQGSKSRLLSFPSRAVAIAGAIYYVASMVYYRPAYQGSEVVYQQAENPNQ